MRVVGYLRVSTDRQAEEGLGLEVQEQAIHEWAEANGHEIAALHRDEGISGSNGVDTRLGLADALAELGEGDGLVVYRLDRLARDLVLQEQLLAEVWRARARVFSCSPSEDSYLTDDPSDPSRALIRQVLGAVSQYERSMISLRLRSGRNRKRLNGGFGGGQVPFGYKSRQGELVEDPHEQATIRRMQTLRSAGVSLPAIARMLEEEGHRPKSSDRWHPQSIARICERVERSLLSGS